MKKALITGISGFAGSYLAEYLASKKELDVYGTYLFEESLGNLNKIREKVKLIKIDLSISKNVFELIENVRPSTIFHLAALSSPADSFNNPTETLTNNISLQINILEAMRNFKLFDTKILVISSADIYGRVKKKDLPIDEQTELSPTSPYSVSKMTQDYLGLMYFLSYSLKVIRIRPFNHIGPRQSSHFVVSSFAKQIAEIEEGKREPILHVGNLEAKRDFTDVRDMVRAYPLAIKKGRDGQVYNVGSGKSYKISEILEKLISMSTVKIKIKEEKELFRPTDTPILLCDASKFKRLTNWEPEISIEKTLKDTLDYWRGII